MLQIEFEKITIADPDQQLARGLRQIQALRVTVLEETGDANAMRTVAMRTFHGNCGLELTGDLIVLNFPDRKEKAPNG